MAEIRDEASLVYLRMRRVFGGRRRRERQGDSLPSDEPFAPGRDPHGIGQVMGRLVRERGWEPTLEKARLAVDWRLVVGDDIAARTSARLNGTVVEVRCQSTAWAANLRLMKSRLLGRIAELLPEVEVTDMRFIGPDAPSWRRGIRSVPGRGPRDTYG
jgi:predicted nucleic acid-binding Zn ribbon protein